MIAQCLYQSDPKNLASMGRQRLACQRAARKLQWGVQKERISETNEPVPLLMRPAVKEILQDAEQHRFDVLLIGNRDSLCCDAADMESFLTVLNSFNIHIFAGGQGSWVEPNGRHYAPLPRLRAGHDRGAHGLLGQSVVRLRPRYRCRPPSAAGAAGGRRRPRRGAGSGVFHLRRHRGRQLGHPFSR